MEALNQFIHYVQNHEWTAKIKSNTLVQKVIQSALYTLLASYAVVVLTQLQLFYNTIIAPVLAGNKSIKEQLKLAYNDWLIGKLLQNDLVQSYVKLLKDQYERVRKNIKWEDFNSVDQAVSTITSWMSQNLIGRNGLDVLLSTVFEEITNVNPNKKLVWVDYGAQSDLSLMANKCRDGNLKSSFSKIYLIASSKKAFEKAQQQVTSMNLSDDLVQVVEHDPVSYRLPNNLKADVVTLSYALTNSSSLNWIELLENIKNHVLKEENGVLGVADFYISRRRPAPGARQHNLITRAVWPLLLNWGLQLSVNADHLPYLENHFESVHVEENMAKVPLVSSLTCGIVRVPYYLFVATTSSKQE
ncbi:hypothetical protein FDP41_008875 [Naegleria fowleri]|uniref:Methyltransferase type 12 domain-containing protein n=1 Tax=Naegleria fowleri TaxID=5763 RepID=A0A6A5BD61_NAEFO|nr:uncharacterized protein FDP41_008875 [Naegleria fowleri]KAF0972626.1 hypothetical protein FDP41_008875 [Naegleria fowleri]CAG4718681.1 unnamed protein product [Naegleria fowleri]